MTMETRADDLRAMNYAVDEARDFLDRHADAHAHALGGLAALAYGMLRAIYESPCHPGTSLVPLTDKHKAANDPPLVGDWWICPACHLCHEYRKEGADAAHGDADDRDPGRADGRRAGHQGRVRRRPS
jgi:hypothetical protein